MKKIFYFTRISLLTIGEEFPFGLIFITAGLAVYIDDLLKTHCSFPSIIIVVFSALSISDLRNWCTKRKNLIKKN
ncbi:MAG: hypothetical protein US50_C0025G0006 [Candidatus Nomurabacteria bacterium GW2011_GWB1_37_5]|uniref:Uncharacterized protein n=1 Tax=Candidatus Nomurabacteria bacterium GW2011_GWB1_37_5 TaxID=1618742 RepID=A0A0G0GYM3_9BACT|nr:MAG: hypothetical protein US50_C0025G0006 [Candidatus Nomurabacteria bacterium GW2011_GWB1_37_5]